MDISIAADSDREQWNQFVDREGGSFFQYYDWKFVYEFKNHNRFLPLMIRDSQSHITGIFPLADQKASRIYPWLSSLPEGGTGGYLLSNSLSDEEKNLHLNLFFEFINNNYSSTHSLITMKEHLSYENDLIESSPLLRKNGFQWQDTSSENLPCIHIVKMDARFPFEEKNYHFPFKRRMRKKIRLVEKTGFHVITDHEFEYLDDFVEMQLQMVKKFNAVADKDELFKISQVFQNKIKLFIGLLDSQPVSAQFCFCTPTTFYLSKAPYLPIAYKYLTNTLPICAAIQYAYEHGYRYVELGQTFTPDLAYHKEQFGATKIPLRIYTKKLSLFKFFTNKLYGFIKD